jgi:hypothetical protein
VAGEGQIDKREKAWASANIFPEPLTTTEKACSSLIDTYSLIEPYVYLPVEAEGERRHFIKVLDEIQHDVILWKKRAPRGVLFNIKSFLCCQKGATAQSPKIRAHHREAAPAPERITVIKGNVVGTFFPQKHIFLRIFLGDLMLCVDLSSI